MKRSRGDHLTWYGRSTDPVGKKDPINLECPSCGFTWKNYSYLSGLTETQCPKCGETVKLGT